MKLTFRARLYAGFSLVVAIFLCVIGITTWQVEQVKADTRDMKNEALMLDPGGMVASCNATNFFWVKDREVRTSTDSKHNGISFVLFNKGDTGTPQLSINFIKSN